MSILKTINGKTIDTDKIKGIENYGVFAEYIRRNFDPDYGIEEPEDNGEIKRYKVRLEASASATAYVEVDAVDEEDAKQKAIEEADAYDPDWDYEVNSWDIEPAYVEEVTENGN